MARDEPIASPTLARLYMSQGHWARARGMVEYLLQRDPLDGDALVLAERLGPLPGRLTARRDGDDLRLHWRGIKIEPAVHLVTVTAATADGVTRVGVTSVRVDKPFGEQRFALPTAHGSLAACIGRVHTGVGWVPMVVASALSW